MFWRLHHKYVCVQPLRHQVISSCEVAHNYTHRLLLLGLFDAIQSGLLTLGPVQMTIPYVRCPAEKNMHPQSLDADVFKCIFSE